MTIPSHYSFPSFPQESSNESLYDYLKNLHFELGSMYEQMAFNINGSFRYSGEGEADQWKPTLSGSTTAGTWTYSSQVGWSLRQGILTELWFDITWTSTTATGTLQLELPYKVALTDGAPFIGLAYDGSLQLLTANTNTYTATFTGVAVSGSGTVSGHIRYIGIEDE